MNTRPRSASRASAGPRVGLALTCQLWITAGTTHIRNIRNIHTFPPYPYISLHAFIHSLTPSPQALYFFCFHISYPPRDFHGLRPLAFKPHTRLAHHTSSAGGSRVHFETHSRGVSRGHAHIHTSKPPHRPLHRHTTSSCAWGVGMLEDLCTRYITWLVASMCTFALSAREQNIARDACFGWSRLRLRLSIWRDCGKHLGPCAGISMGLYLCFYSRRYCCVYALRMSAAVHIST